MSNLRFQVVEEAFKKRPLEVEVPKERPSEYFGKYVFTRAKMYKYLPAAIYTQLTDVIDNGTPSSTRVSSQGSIPAPSRGLAGISKMPTTPCGCCSCEMRLTSSISS